MDRLIHARMDPEIHSHARLARGENRADQCSSRSIAAAWPRRLALSLVRMLWTWFLTVGSSICRRAAISLLDRPCSSSAAISRSREVSGEVTGRVLGRSRQPPEQQGGEPRRAHGAAARRGLDRLRDVIDVDVARQHAADPGLGPGDHRLLVGVGDVEHDDPRRRHRGLELPQALEAGRGRHVEQHRLGRLVRPGERFQRVRHVAGRPDDVEPLVAPQQPGETVPVEPDLGDDEHARHLGPLEGTDRSGPFHSGQNPIRTREETLHP